MPFWASPFLLKFHPCLFKPPHFSIVDISFAKEHLPVGYVGVQPYLCEEALRPKKALKKEEEKSGLRSLWRRRKEEIVRKLLGNFLVQKQIKDSYLFTIMPQVKS